MTSCEHRTLLARATSAFSSNDARLHVGRMMDKSGMRVITSSEADVLAGADIGPSARDRPITLLSSARLAQKHEDSRARSSIRADRRARTVRDVATTHEWSNACP